MKEEDADELLGKEGKKDLNIDSEVTAAAAANPSSLSSSSVAWARSFSAELDLLPLNPAWEARLMILRLS